MGIPQKKDIAPRSRRRAQCGGFSLVELSIVVVIISVVAVMGLEVAASFMNRTAYKVTQERLEAIDTAILNYRKVNGRLPCPALRDTPAAICYGKGAYSGHCNDTTAACAATSWGSNAYRYGDVPVRDLNLPLDYMVDGYGRKFIYAVTSSMTSSATFSAASDGFAIRSGKQDASCGTTNLLCQDIGNSSAADAAYVVFSAGSDGRGALTPAGGSPASCTSISTTVNGRIDVVNCRLGGSPSPALEYSIPDNVFYDSRYNVSSVEQNYFDDVIKWRSKKDL